MSPSQAERFFTLSPDLLCIVGFNGQFHQINPAFEAILGYNWAALQGQSWLQLVHPDDYFVTQATWQTIKAVTMLTLETRYRCRDGTYCWLDWHFTPMLEEGVVYAIGHDLTLQKQLIENDHRQAETALLESQTRLNMALEAAQMGTWDWNVVTNEVVYSEHLGPILGLPQGTDHSTHEDFLNTVHPDDRELVTQAIIRTFEEGAEYALEYRTCWRDGTVHWVGNWGRVYRDRRGRPMRMIGIAMDIHNRKQTEAAIQSARNFLQTMIDHLPVAVFVKDGSPEHFGTFRLWNKTSEQLFGVTAEQALGKTVHDCFPPDRAAWFHQQDQECFSQGQPEDVAEDEFESHLGKRLLHTVKVPIYNHHHEPQYLLGIADDITERKRAEVELRQSKADLELRVAERTAALTHLNQQLQSELVERLRTQEALQVSQARFAGILEIAHDAIIAINSAQQIILFNQGAETVFGYAAAEVLHQPLDCLMPVRFIQAHRQHVATFNQAGHPAQPMGKRREIFGRRKNGQEFPAEASISRLDLGDEKILTVILRDVSDRDQMERMKDEFISIVSHELRTPLAAIHGSLGMLASGLVTQPEKERRLLQIAADSTDRLIRLINDILDIERIESGKVQIVKTPCRVVDLMTQACNMVQPLFDQAGITLATDPSLIQDLAIAGDGDRIVQTFTNLLSNAIKFSPAATTVWFTAVPQAQMVQFNIQDQGRGIPPDQLDTIFERFQQVDASDSRNHEGTGLGLAICRSIVHQHGGKIWVDSTLGQGSTFHFTVPLLVTHPLRPADPEPNL
jgi:PAS domain S-box-containing protein